MCFTPLVVRRFVLSLLTGALLLAGCSGGDKTDEAPPSPELSRKPPPGAANRGPFLRGPVPAARPGAVVGAGIKPGELAPVGGLAAVDPLENALGRRLRIINTYRRFEQMVGTSSDKEFLAQ